MMDIMMARKWSQSLNIFHEATDWLSAFDKYIFIIAQIIFQTASMNIASLEYFKSFSVFIKLYIIKCEMII